MKLKTLALATGLAISAMSVAVSAQAAVLDAWQMQITGDTYTNIGRLSLTAGSAKVYQELNATNQVFVGAKFVEDSTVYSISYVQNNVVGPTDTGAPTSFSNADKLSIMLSGVKGHVTSLSAGGGYGYAFDSGIFTVKDYAGTNSILATGNVIGTTGSFLDHAGFAVSMARRSLTCSWLRLRAALHSNFSIAREPPLISQRSYSKRRPIIRLAMDLATLCLLPEPPTAALAGLTSA